MARGFCRLCGIESELLQSHIIPAFVFRWMRDTSGTGHIRLGTAPNLRAQDGIKRFWMCSSCEILLNEVETLFATRIFHPFCSGASDQARYGPWLLKFCVSVSWRVLRFYKEEHPPKDYPPDVVSRMEEAEATWKAVLLGQKPNPEPFVQHLLPLDAIESATYEGLPPNINRYLMRAADMDLVRGTSLAFTYAKFGRFVLLGFVKLDHPNQWRGTKVHGAEGTLMPRTYTVPSQFGDYLMSKARRMAELNAAISDRQREKIDKAFWKNIDRLADTDALRAMEHDVRLFGNAAFDRTATDGGDER